MPTLYVLIYVDYLRKTKMYEIFLILFLLYDFNSMRYYYFFSFNTISDLPGPTPMDVTGTPKYCSMNSTYLRAFPGKSDHVRHFDMLDSHPGRVTYSTSTFSSNLRSAGLGVVSSSHFRKKTLPGNDSIFFPLRW